MIVGTEWLIEAEECNENLLRDEAILRAVFSRIINDLGLKTLGKPLWHKFGGEGGVTGLVMLTESHLACHTYPEHKTATFNLYCCRSRAEWNWEANLKEILDAKNISITKIERGSNSNAVVPTAVGGASRFQNNFPNVNFGEVKIRNRGLLPHWEKENGIYFVTFRLADSLPQNIIQTLEIEQEQTTKILSNLERELSIDEKRKVDWLFSDKADKYLDQNFGECYLRNPEIAEIVSNSLKHFDNERYHLFAWCIMPNHVHVVFRPLQNNKIDEILHSWKSFTAHKINNILKKDGIFWQREYYDHLVRDQEEFERIIQYVSDNPIKANLKNWNWVWAYGKYNEAKAS
jgi:S-adenosylmethionine decarboxylase proenzyme